MEDNAVQSRRLILTFNTESGPAGGLMVLPDDAKKMGVPPHWMIYVGTPNVDDTAAGRTAAWPRTAQPADIPGTGRFAVVRIRIGATFGIYAPRTPPPGQASDRISASCHGSLATPKPEGAWNFYQSLFGWEKTSAMDMGEMGIYQMFGRGGDPNGGIAKPLPTGAPAAWQPYIQGRRREGCRGHRAGSRRQDRQRPDGSSRQAIGSRKVLTRRGCVRRPLVEARREAPAAAAPEKAAPPKKTAKAKPARKAARRRRRRAAPNR